MPSFLGLMNLIPNYIGINIKILTAEKAQILNLINYNKLSRKKGFKILKITYLHFYLQLSTYTKNFKSA